MATRNTFEAKGQTTGSSKIAYVSSEQVSDLRYELSVSPVSEKDYDLWLSSAIILRQEGDNLRREREFTIFCNRLRLLGLELVEE